MIRTTGAPLDESSVERELRQFGIAGQFRMLCSLPPRHLASLFAEAYNQWLTDDAARLGAALSYYTLFSIAPLLIVIVSAVGFVFGGEAARGEILPRIEHLVGTEAARAIELLLAQTTARAGGVIASVTGVVSLFLGASLVVNELRSSLNRVWNVQSPTRITRLIDVLRELFADRFYAFCLVLGAGLLLVMSVVVNTAVAAAGSYFRSWLPMPELALQTINFVVAFAMSTWIFALLYKTVPDARVAWGDAFVGAAVTALLFDIGNVLIAMFVGKAAPASVYGTAGSVLALLLWVYYSAQVFLFGAEVTRVFATRYGGMIVPHRHGSGLLVRGPADWVRRIT